MPLILSGNVTSATAGAYEVANSCRFNDDDDARIGLDFSGAGNLDTWTMSAWVKRCTLGANSSIFTCNGLGAGAQKGTLRFDSTDKISCYVLFAGSAWHYITSNAVFRDTSAWYHIVIRCDTTQSTDTDRLRLYVNGTLQTLSGSAYPDQNEDTFFNEAEEHQIGSLIDETEDGDMYLAEFCWIDGSSLAPTSFGEFDSDSPTIWKPIDVSGLTFGTNGGYFEFSDSSDLGVNTKGNDWTPTNLAAVDQATDSPTNNFCTMNPLIKGSNITLKEGNCITVGNSTSNNGACGSTFQIPQSGKWFFEYKMIADDQGNTYPNSGIKYDSTASQANMNDGWPGDIYVYGTYGSRLINVNSGTHITSGAPASSGDIFSWYIDQDNGAIYIAENGTMINSGDPTSGASKTGAIFSYTVSTYPEMIISANEFGNSETQWNFGGCPSFAISSSNADADGYGNFEYDPQGYYALNTKNLATYG